MIWETYGGQQFLYALTFSFSMVSEKQTKLLNLIDCINSSLMTTFSKDVLVIEAFNDIIMLNSNYTNKLIDNLHISWFHQRADCLVDNSLFLQELAASLWNWKNKDETFWMQKGDLWCLLNWIKKRISAIEFQAIPKKLMKGKVFKTAKAPSKSTCI